MWRTVLLSMLFGVAWHFVVVALVGPLEWFTMGIGLPVAALTGGLAGLFTVWSRRRRPGSESTFSVVATYYFALLVYAIGMALTKSILYAYEGRSGPTYTLTWSRIGDEVAVFVAYGTMFAVLLLPLCYVTRLLVWRAHRRIRSHQPQDRRAAWRFTRGTRSN